MNNEKKAPVLTLEHIAPYLPYGIRVKVGKTERNLTAVSLDSTFVFVSAWKGSREKEMVSIEEIKPILRPLSDLTKVIEHNGERFVPVVNLGWNSYDHILKSGTCINISYEYMVKLFKWHFDVFGLIEKGLAIDINSIEGKETKENG
ncbi:hypothetical protein [Sphingobacterium sp. UGAL515B_05]|uniref:hypothetical protein n=1 Tax=Sphingobacterium sp. UGAL515B_05 TaxID=2986767 RepID=UPI00295588C0|nr:hypothetical protein [Sphingobacterium sp. UGAL515B_05]WON94737.1 hypothetical protein OK025_26315 [Sphingobacterium sp. UGAL515B_05]